MFRPVGCHAAHLALAALALATSAAPAAAAVRTFSYDPADEATRKVAGDLTFQFNQRLVFTKVLNIRSTEGQASAALRPADEHALGAGGLSRLIGADGRERDLYEVEPAAQGADMIHAFCPGSSRAWLAFGRLVEGEPLRVRVLGDAPGGGARLCHTFAFNYRGEWKLPAGPGVKPSELKEPHFPY
ncbi:MAG TPA: hypothetical protein VFE13_03665 [Caulobacteraceae bacterium]|nr:hypothetical protein [Caulobacteraceae bacterium]